MGPNVAGFDVWTASFIDKLRSAFAFVLRLFLFHVGWSCSSPLFRGCVMFRLLREK